MVCIKKHLQIKEIWKQIKYSKVVSWRFCLNNSSKTWCHMSQWKPSKDSQAVLPKSQWFSISRSSLNKQKFRWHTFCKENKYLNTSTKICHFLGSPFSNFKMEKIHARSHKSNSYYWLINSLTVVLISYKRPGSENLCPNATISTFPTLVYCQILKQTRACKRY